MNNQKLKYHVFISGTAHSWDYWSNSRNARKHLVETNAAVVDVVDGNGELVCRAVKHFTGMILVGAVPKR